MMDNILSEHSARQYSPLTLAFLGDAVYSELVRRRLVMTANMSVKKLHPKSVEYVRAGYQARAYDVIQDILTEAEADILRRGRNASPSNSSIPKKQHSRRIPQGYSSREPFRVSVPDRAEGAHRRAFRCDMGKHGQKGDIRNVRSFKME